MEHIKNTSHPVYEHLLKLKEDGHYRILQNTALISGYAVVKESVEKGIVKKIYCSKSFKDEFEKKNITIVTLEEKLFKRITGTVSPQTICAEVKLPTFAQPTQKEKWIILDRVSDPGNIGTLMRSAVAFGWDGVWSIEGSCDFFNEKLIRAAKGAHWQLKLHTSSLDECISYLKNHNIEVFSADLVGESLNSIHTKNPIVILGNEGQGVCPQLLSISKAVTIPIAGIESLNVAVAGSIFMYNLAKR